MKMKQWNRCMIYKMMKMLTRTIMIPWNSNTGNALMPTTCDLDDPEITDIYIQHSKVS